MGAHDTTLGCDFAYGTAALDRAMGVGGVAPQWFGEATDAATDATTDAATDADAAVARPSVSGPGAGPIPVGESSEAERQVSYPTIEGDVRMWRAYEAIARERAAYVPQRQVCVEEEVARLREIRRHTFRRSRALAQQMLEKVVSGDEGWVGRRDEGVKG